MFYRNDSISSELAPLRFERGNHCSTAALPGDSRQSSRWAHSGTGGATETGARERGGGMRTRAEVVPGVPQPDCVLPTDAQSRRVNNIPAPARTPPACVSGKNAAPKCRVFLAVSQTPPTHTRLRALAPAVASQECSLPTASFQPLLKHHFSNQPCPNPRPSHP